MSKRKNNKKSLSRRRRRNNVNRNPRPREGNLLVRDNPRFPNDIKMIPIQSRVIRFNASSTAQAVRPLDLLKMLVMTTSGSTTAYEVMQAIRIRRISMYWVNSGGDFGNNNVFLSFQWSGATNASDILITDRGTATEPACIKVVPPRDSIASMWFDANSPAFSNTLFTVTCPQNTIIDIDFEYIFSNGVTSTVTLNANATTTGGAIIGLFTGHWVPDGNVIFYHE